MSLIMKSTDCVGHGDLCRQRGQARCILKENSNIAGSELINSLKKKKKSLLNACLVSLSRFEFYALLYPQLKV